MKLGNINGHRYVEFSYSECVKAFGTSDFANRLDCVNVSAQNDSLIVYLVCCINIEDKTVVYRSKIGNGFLSTKFSIHSQIKTNKESDLFLTERDRYFSKRANFVDKWYDKFEVMKWMRSN